MVQQSPGIARPKGIPFERGKGLSVQQLVFCRQNAIVSSEIKFIRFGCEQIVVESCVNDMQCSTDKSESCQL